MLTFNTAGLSSYTMANIIWASLLFITVIVTCLFIVIGLVYIYRRLRHRGQRYQPIPEHGEEEPGQVIEQDEQREQGERREQGEQHEQEERREQGERHEQGGGELAEVPPERPVEQA